MVKSLGNNIVWIIVLGEKDQGEVIDEYFHIIQEHDIVEELLCHHRELIAKGYQGSAYCHLFHDGCATSTT
jgi:hypothetical protein